MYNPFDSVYDWWCDAFDYLSDIIEDMAKFLIYAVVFLLSPVWIIPYLIIRRMTHYEDRYQNHR